MKRLLLIALLVPGVALAFDRSPGKPSIGILVHGGGELSYVQRCVVDSLRDQLRGRGFDAYVEEMSFDDLAYNPDRDADYYVDVVGDGETNDYAGVGIGNRAVDVSLAVVATHVAAEVRVYDGRTMQLIASKTLKRSSTGVLPTHIGFGGRDAFAVFALPFVERAQVRGVARAAAKQMAEHVTTSIREK